VNFGVDQRGSGFLRRACLRALRITGLHDVGYKGMPSRYDDSNFTLLKTGMEAGSDFGVVGFLSFVGSVWIVLRGGWRTTEWRLAASGFVCFGTLCAIIAWQPWNFRFLLLPFLLFLLAFLLSVSAYFERKPSLRWLALLVILHGVFLYPIGSFNEAPRDLWASIFHRDDATFKERPGVQPVVKAVRNAVAEEHMAVLFLDASTKAWVLPFFQIKKLHVLPRPRMTEAPVPAGLLQDGQSAGLLVLDLPFGPRRKRVGKCIGDSRNPTFSFMIQLYICGGIPEILANAIVKTAACRPILDEQDITQQTIQRSSVVERSAVNRDAGCEQPGSSSGS
jgi:hypothetical protein